MKDESFRFCEKTQFLGVCVDSMLASSMLSKFLYLFVRQDNRILWYQAFDFYELVS